MSSKGYDPTDEDDENDPMLPDHAQLIGKIKTENNGGLVFTGEHLAMFQRLLDTAKERVENNPPGDGITVGATSPEIEDGGRHYRMQFSISLVPVDAKVRAH